MSCAPPASDERASALDDLERLAFVGAPLDHYLNVQGPDDESVQLPFRLREPVLVDRFEVTRSQWLEWLASGTAPSNVRAATGAEAWHVDELDRPATFMDLIEARRFAEWRGMRLMTAEEWIVIAIGPATPYPFPWGHEDRAALANTLELGLGRSCKVGTFPAGNSPFGLSDLLGNVWEWTDSLTPGAQSDPGVDFGTVLGGSFLTRKRRMYEGGRLFSATRHAGSRASDVGLRCAVAAEDYLWQHADDWLAADDARARLIAVGRRWGRAAVACLEDLIERDGAPEALGLLLEGARS